MRAALLIATAGFGFAALPVADARADDVQVIIDQATLDEFHAYLRVLTGVDPIPGDPPVYLENRYSYGEDIRIAGQWIYDHFVACGLEATFHTFDPSFGPNVIGELPGTTRPQDIYVIGGHYDTYHAADQYHAPGCDDNGSGTAAVMMAARVLGQYDFEGTLRFITFSGEEQWMVGSQAYAAAAAAAGDNIVAVINLDMFLQPGFDDHDPDPDYDLDIGGNHASQWLGQYLADQFAAYAPIDVQLHDDDGFVSNQWSFWPYGYDAVGLIENTPWEIWGGSNDAYHQLTDTIDNPDYDWDFAMEVVRGSIAGLVGLAGLVPCQGDLDGDREIGLGDLAILLAHYPTPSGATYEDGDLDDDQDVDLADLAVLLSVYGTSCD